MNNIITEKSTKDEILSSACEALDGAQQEAGTYRSERNVLALLLALSVAWGLIF